MKFPADGTVGSHEEPRLKEQHEIGLAGGRSAPRVMGELLRFGAVVNPVGGVLDADSTLHPWAQLDNAALGLACWLVDHGVGPGDRVAVLHPKSVSSFVAVHAIVRCGAIMVPLDPRGPKQSVEAVLRFCKPRALIGSADTVAARASRYVATTDVLLAVSGDLSPLDNLAITPDRLVSLAVAMASPQVDLPLVEPDQPAYIIFTSGSTGEPKGIAHSHASALAYAHNAVKIHGLLPTDRVAGTSPLHFDMSTFELYACPLAGATAVTVTEGTVRFPATLSQQLQDARVTVVYAVPYQLRQLSLRGDVANRDLSALRQISFGGEQFSPGALQELAHSLPPAELLNVYGPAEVNGVASQRWDPHPVDLAAVPIGTAWPGVDLRIVDEDLVDVSPGESGELLATCDSQMIGYWLMPDSNEQSFVFEGDRRWYRTGDIVRKGADNLLYFLGRADTRVKVRGVRLELETIETVVGDAPGVQSVVVGVREDDQGIQYVVAWVLPLGNQMLSADELRRWCVTRLPSSAVPSEIRFVDDFAQTRTGKIDRKLLRQSLST